MLSGWWVCTYVFDWLFLDSILDVLVVLSPLSRTFKFFSHNWSAQRLSKVVCVPGETGSESLKPLACVMQETWERAANGTCVFHPPNPALYLTAKRSQFCPQPGYAPPEQHDGPWCRLPRKVLRYGQGWTQRSSTPPSARGQNRGVSLWVTREPGQELRIGVHLR